MQVHVHSNRTVHTPASVQAWAERTLSQALQGVQAEVDRVDLHLADLPNGTAGPAHPSCTVEVRLHGRPPVVVQHQAEGLDDALQGACDKLQRSLQRALARQRDTTHRQRTSIHGDPGLDGS